MLTAPPVTVPCAFSSATSPAVPFPRHTRSKRVSRYSTGLTRSNGTRALAWQLWRTRRLPPLNHGYLYLQEFLADNAYDTRVTVIGNRAFAFRRFNRDGDFRASGSGKISWEPAAIDPAIVRLAFRIAAALGTQSIAIDGLYRGDEVVAGEISYTFAAWAIAARTSPRTAWRLLPGAAWLPVRALA